MSESKHTPGPWSVAAPSNGKVRAVVGNMDTNARVADVGDKGMPVAEINANARLIASAPDLLAACKAVLPWVAILPAYREDAHPDAVENHAADLAALQAAIAKAEA